MSIGIMGGTFNPIHYGHLRTAAEVADQFELEKILFIPVSLPPHKEAGEIASADHRRSMTELGIRDDRRFILNLAEFGRKGTSYTIDTLRQLRKDLYPGENFFFITGIDSFCEIPTWKEARKCFFLTNFIVTTRPGFLMEEIVRIFRYPIFKGLNIIETDEGETLRCRSLKVNDSPYNVFISETTPIPISSTEIREKIKKGERFSGYLPKAVEEYIIDKGIYRD